jgi:putative flippase GtrA
VSVPEEQITRRSLCVRVAAYLVVGFTSFGVDFGVLVGLREGLGVAVWIATTAGYWTSVGFNYVLNRRVSFGDRRTSAASLWRYGVLLAVNWVATLLIVHVAEVVGVGYALGKVAAVGALTLLNFVAYSRWVFADQT